MSSMDALILLIATFPIVIWAAWSDLKFMTIPNKACIALFLLFVISGPFLFTLPEYGIRIAQGFVILVIGFLLTTAGVMGGGDSKLFAAIAPYVIFPDVGKFFFILSFLALAAVLIHRSVPRFPSLLRVFEGWKSFGEKRHFPFGLPLAAALTVYLGYVAKPIFL